MTPTRLTAAILFLIFTFSLPVFAQTMESGNYRLELGQFDTAAEGQVAGVRDNSLTTVVIKTGFADITNTDPFIFSINPTSVNFTSLVPETPVTKEVIISLSPGATRSYQITAIADSPLTSSRGQRLPDTICDESLCTPLIAGRWTSLKTGFGYSLFGDDIPTDFLTKDYFRPFPAKTRAGKEVVIMSGYGLGQRQATIIYKLISGNDQPAGAYSNVITLTAMPRY